MTEAQWLQLKAASRYVPAAVLCRDSSPGLRRYGPKGQALPNLCWLYHFKWHVSKTCPGNQVCPGYIYIIIYAYYYI